MPRPFDSARPVTSELLGGLLRQLEDEGLAVADGDGYVLPWDAVYELMEHPEYAQAIAWFELPAVAPVQVTVSSRDTLEDSTFDIAVGDWRLGPEMARYAVLCGAILKHESERILLPPALWALVREVRAFAKRDSAARTGQANRQGWGRIRRLAISAGANLDAFLYRSVVLTPEKLAIGLRKAVAGDDTVIEVQPGFDGAPPDWLHRFDRQATVQDRYDIPTAEGIVQVVVSPKVRTVLEEIKLLPLRRVAGARAQAFILNPYATLGEDANEVIDEQQFETARADAGLNYERFLPQFERDAFGYPLKVGLLIEVASGTGPVSSETRWLSDDELAKFAKVLKSALARKHLLLGWEGYDFELQGEAPEYLQQLEQALEERRKPPVLIKYAQVYDLTNYASRVQKVGFEQPYYSPYIAKKKDDEGWFPDNIIPLISWVPEGETAMVSMPLGPEHLAGFRQQVVAAKAAGKTSITLPGTPNPIPIGEAERLLDTFTEASEEAKEGKFDPGKPKRPRPEGPIKRTSLIIGANIHNIDYAEKRRAALASDGREPELPASLRPEHPLLPHQRQGVAWLQTLFEAHDTFNCRGAVLADDMGLGKTLQLLILMAWAIEKNPNIEPMLVVAPVSLLENWKEEAEKFLTAGALSTLTAYGDNLSSLRVPRASIDERLITEDGLTRFLRPDWIGDARVVLTTYETLRDLEFSFASQRWSIMICDEAQKIKNPAAMVTRAAKKQNVAFKIACTGTPVENTLADIWCLFDFVQPGLLGALNDFGHRYRKPIEAKTNAERARVEELRGLIDPQILRRTKAKVAKDLPRKIVAEECRRLPLSNKQRELYGWAIDLFKRRNDPGANAPFKNHLGLLHYLRLICTDPRRHGLDVFKSEKLSDYRARAPKLDWLLEQLKTIERKREKVIIFCEFRPIQRLLQYYIHEALGLRPDIINGDTSASPIDPQNRQKRIKAFQEMPGFGVIILSPLAVGFGVNIQAANHVVHYTRMWNPAKEDQATDRAYRIGQKKDVYVYYPVVRAEDFTTFDVKLDRLLDEKRLLASDMLNGAGDLRPSEFNLDDVAPPGTFNDNELVTLETALSMNWKYFEALATVLYAKRGYDAHRTPSAKDNGIDIVALPREQQMGKLIQVKSSGIEGKQLGWDAVKDVVGGHEFYAKKFPRVGFELACLTNRYFDEQTHRNAKLNRVELLEQPHLQQMLNETPVMMIDIEKILYPNWSDA
ncbi:MAG: restriction endonuclease [Gammaproteobacteria bacterium]|nr:restriction endonuclease [Gammaproteobacteria bacterium]